MTCPKPRKTISREKAGLYRGVARYGARFRYLQPVRESLMSLCRNPKHLQHRVETVCIKMPSGNGLGPRVRDNADGTICVEYEPKKEGMHEVLMSYDGSGVDGEYSKIMVE
ncbi:hypothetical protein RRG08_022855 [Elysia crispata]|uniref:Uncharacterized protein n=1 Tax=Elysia crispata TaxID=231223 RepID=A0AAE0Z2A8_9GAST|nr:hypothetical protein RRG08_022855 [Elysia crispata]